MHRMILSSGRDTLLVAIPFVVMLLITIFRLDEALSTSQGAIKRRRSVCGTDEEGEPVLRDPDGRVVTPRSPRK
jgi:hypothetical protein